MKELPLAFLTPNAKARAGHEICDFHVVWEVFSPCGSGVSLSSSEIIGGPKLITRVMLFLGQVSYRLKKKKDPILSVLNSFDKAFQFLY